MHVANDANTAALGEFTYGGAGGSGLMVLTVGQGVGAGIVLDGALVQGHRHAAGELGHVTVVDDDGAGGPAATARAAGGAASRRCSRCRRCAAGSPGSTAPPPTPSWPRSGACSASRSPRSSARSTCPRSCSPRPAELLDGPLLRAAQTTIQQRTMPVVGADLRLRMASLGEDVALSGAAVLVLSGQLGVT